MQYHQNGYRPGDPRIAPASEDRGRWSPGSLPEEVDVLIVGCGPAGLTLAAQLSRFPAIRTRIIEAKSGPLERGQADGIACRSMEMFNTFGFAQKVMQEAYWVNETTFWKPDPEEPNNILRNGRILDTEPGLSEFPHVILNQARIHDMYLDCMRNSPTRLEPDYGRSITGLDRDPGEDDFPLTVTISPTSGNHPIEKIRARYVVGCDGARSAVRKLIGQKLVGDSANQAWGVMDILGLTDFPDIRLKSLVQSSDGGSAVIIPREGGNMVRMYIELDNLEATERVKHRDITLDQLVDAARKILHPYNLSVAEIPWWSIYEIGQRLCPRFDDANADREPHVFIAGDACHTHSPKAGLGMNVSMGDAFNLGWKLASVLENKADKKLLHTYSAERQATARELIDFDREWSKMIGTPPKSDENPDGVDPEDFQEYFVKHGRFTAGTSFCYGPSEIVHKNDQPSRAPGFPVGSRFHSAPVVRLADAKPMQLGHVQKADARWQLFVFAPAEDPIAATTNFLGAIQQNCSALKEEDGCLDFRIIFQGDHKDIDLSAMPEFLLPKFGALRLTDYERLFTANIAVKPDIFDARGIPRIEGCAVLVRPDQHVSLVSGLDQPDMIGNFFKALQSLAAKN